MNRYANLFWALVLVGSLASVIGGFARGRSVAHRAIVRVHLPAVPPPEPAIARVFERELRGAHSFDDAVDTQDAYDAADDAVAGRPGGWAPEHFDERHDRGRVAIVVIDAGVAGTPAGAFLRSAIPFTIVVPAADDADTVRHDALANGKRVLVDVTDSTPAQIAASRRLGAIGAIGSIAATNDARGIVGALGPHAIAIDALLDDGDAFYQAARQARIMAVTRDAIVDSRSTAPFLDAMFGSVLAIARRTGVAIVALHARPQSLDAAERFAARARRAGVDIVPIDALPLRSAG